MNKDKIMGCSIFPPKNKNQKPRAGEDAPVKRTDESTIRSVANQTDAMLPKVAHPLQNDMTIHDSLASPISISLLSPMKEPSSVEKSIRDLSKENATFVWFQLLIETLVRMPQSDEARDELLNASRQKYNDDPVELAKIERFDQECHLNVWIRWYTSDSFLYRLLNAAFRTENIDEIYKYRFFVRGLSEQLFILYQNYVHAKRSNNINSIIVYRGQSMSNDELQRITVNNFLTVLVKIETRFQSSYITEVKSSSNETMLLLISEEHD